jgi:hypothetical protein
MSILTIWITETITGHYLEEYFNNLLLVTRTRWKPATMYMRSSSTQAPAPEHLQHIKACYYCSVRAQFSTKLEYKSELCVVVPGGGLAGGVEAAP